MEEVQFLQGENGKSIIEDLDFLMRFFKKEHYHTQPAILLVGANEDVSHIFLDYKLGFVH